MSYHLYDGKDMGPFRSFCLGAAAVSCLGFWWTGTRLDVGRLNTFKREVTTAFADFTTYVISGTHTGARTKASGREDKVERGVR